MYIEGTLPSFFNFILNDQVITIGTDSLASNDSLCVLSELKEIHQQYPEINLIESIKWATWNGAELLGISDQFGSIEVGKKPGLNLIQYTQGLNLTEKSSVKKLI
jgi:cytosine/adenosine deaminase-related metal-dependent hydrolase